ncbi:protein mono-ADP-ribosyltransferase TIPARP-like [Penaeus indicus]|uniref:protein mono-ADP-ribosyltransferase TIPARP-like n=1 Tax=Penaeus indicus TaxID=29960 RepID=UPI00300CA613
MTQQCQFLFRTHGIATNDSQINVVTSLVSDSPDLSDSKPVTPPQGEKRDKVTENSITASLNKQKRVRKKAKNPANGRPPLPADSSTEKSDTSNKPKTAKQLNDALPDRLKGVVKDASPDETHEKEQIKTEDFFIYKTCWSVDVLGNVDIQEICCDSVEGLCAKEATGCPRLHAPQHFQWQISDLVSPNWYNLPVLHAKCLEISYCDPAQDNITLPRLDPSTQSPPIDGLLPILGRDVWKADFQKLELTNSLSDKKLQLRRLCTEPVADLNIMASNYIWYFLDDSNAWVPFGSNAENPYAKSLSAKIEKHFSQKRCQKIKMVVNNHTYILDFLTMRQANEKTNTVRNVRRRPSHHLDVKKETPLLPHTWTPMYPETQMVQFLLSTSSSEYLKIAALIQRPLATEGLKIVRIRRIQNPQLWRNFQCTKKSLKADSRVSSLEDLQVFKSHSKFT